jgi:hypothetical protein
VVTAAKIERLKSISVDDARDEGMGPLWPIASFVHLWNDLHGAGSFEANPEVVALSFAVYKCNIDAMPPEIAT